jgi:hypothetical protein
MARTTPRIIASSQQARSGKAAPLGLSGTEVKRLMRIHKVTMRAIKTRHQITLKRIRTVRTEGVKGFMADNWLYIITGKWPDETPATTGK